MDAPRAASATGPRALPPRPLPVPPGEGASPVRIVSRKPSFGGASSTHDVRPSMRSRNTSQSSIEPPTPRAALQTSPVPLVGEDSAAPSISGASVTDEPVGSELEPEPIEEEEDGAEGEDEVEAEVKTASRLTRADSLGRAGLVIRRRGLTTEGADVTSLPVVDSSPEVIPVAPMPTTPGSSERPRRRPRRTPSTPQLDTQPSTTDLGASVSSRTPGKPRREASSATLAGTVLGSSRRPPREATSASTLEPGGTPSPLGPTAPRRTRTEPLFPSAAVVQAPSTSMYWSRAPVHGRLPSKPLRSHTATLVGNAIWVFGGTTDNSKHVFNTMYKLDLDTFAWSKPRAGGQLPPPCRAHSATLYESRIYIFGGGDGPNYFNEVYCFDTKTLLWTKPTVVGPLPSKRRAHAAILYKHAIIIFGGGNGNRALNDCHVLDLSNPERLEWRPLETKGPRPLSRGYHTMTLVNNKAVVYGGSDGQDCFADVSVLDLECDVPTWTIIEVSGTTTPNQYARLSHSVALLGSHLVIFGGHTGVDYSQQLFMFNLVTCTFETDSRCAAGIAPLARGYSSMTYADGRLIVIGGHSGSRTFDDVHILELGAAGFMPQIQRWTSAGGI